MFTYWYIYISQWKDATLLVISKRNSNPITSSLGERIVKKNACCKLLFGLLTKRMGSYPKNVHGVLTKKHWFRKERFTETLYKILMADFKKALATLHNTLYTAFVNFKATRRSGTRFCLRCPGWVSICMSLIFFTASTQERITIDDKVAKIPPFIQMTGLTYEDNSSPLLSWTLLKGLPAEIGKQKKNTRRYLVFSGLKNIGVKTVPSTICSTSSLRGRHIFRTDTESLQGGDGTT